MELSMELGGADRRPLYEQIYGYIRDEIKAGKILPGEKLPSTRVLAGNLHVARSTAELAYEQLKEEGYIEVRRGSGAYVKDAGSRFDLGSKRSKEEGSQAKDKKNSPASRGQKEAEAVFADFSPGKIDMSVFPYATWRRILRGILTGERSDLFDRGEPMGDEALRSTIAHYLHLSRGCKCEARQIVVGAGNDYLMMLLSMVLGEGRQVGMESPTYPRAAAILEAMHDEVVPIRSDTYGICVEDLEQTFCSLVYVMPARQYPSGVTMPYPRREALLHWAAQRPNRYIIEDDYDSEFKYRGRPVPSLQSGDYADKVIYIGTFSKAIAPAIRVSYLILPKGLLKKFQLKASVMSCTVPRLDQSVLDAFIRDGYFERYLNRMRNRYHAKHDLLLEQLAGLDKLFRIRGSGAGLHLLLEVRNPAAWDEKDAAGESRKERNRRLERILAEKARKNGVIVYPMSDFYLKGELPAGQESPPTILLGFAALDEEKIREGVARLIKAWEVPD